MNGIHQILVYAKDLNLIVEDIGTIKINEDVLLNACKDIGLAGKIKDRKKT